MPDRSPLGAGPGTPRELLAAQGEEVEDDPVAVSGGEGATCFLHLTPAHR